MLDQTQPDMFRKLALDEDAHSGLPEENVRFLSLSIFLVKNCMLSKLLNCL